MDLADLTKNKKVKNWNMITKIENTHKGLYFNYVSTFLSIFDQLSTLVSIFTTVPDNSYSTVVSILQTK